ncbi:MAG: hypothetical protein OEW08_01400 [Gammaproteobacteria bacterium]|nr:hypothetical protein [Gammaproteobacteria bacterium]
MQISNIRTTLENFYQQYWGWIALALWVGIFSFLPVVSYDTNGIDEGAARALLLNWAIADRVINPIVILGMPDFRALLFAPLSIYWPGSMIAAKVFALITFAAGIAWTYRWARARLGDEAAMLGLGLMLFAPLTLTQVNGLGNGPFLLAGMALLWRIEEAYAKSTRVVGGLFYFRLLVIGITVTLHPAALGYPLALLWHWRSNPTGDAKQRTQVIGGILITLLVVGVLRAGWIDLAWWSNPVASLSTLIDQPALDDTPEWPLGIIPLIALAGTLAAHWRSWPKDNAGLGWLLAIVIGACSADGAWGLLVLGFILTYGLAGLLNLHTRLRQFSFVGQRGLVLVLLFAMSLVYMRDDKILYDLNSANVMASRDRLLRVLSAEVEGNKTRVTTASQWPGQTMLACRCEVLPLPPVGANTADFEKSIRGLRYIIFNPGDPTMLTLKQRIAELNNVVKTVAMEDHSVLLEVAPQLGAAPTTAK